MDTFSADILPIYDISRKVLTLLADIRLLCMLWPDENLKLNEVAIKQ